MRRNLRAVGTSALTLALAAWLGAGATVRGQDAAQMPFCAILSAEEVSGAVGADLAPTSGDERRCDYASPAEDPFTAVTVANGGWTMDLARQSARDGEEVMVAGQPSWISPSRLYIDRGDGDTLNFDLISPPDGTDPREVLTSLGELAFPRLATLVFASPTPVVQADAELAALFPTEIAGAPVTVQTISGDSIAQAPTEVIAGLEAILASQGKTIADVSTGRAESIDSEYRTVYNINAVRIRDADVGQLAEDLMAWLLQTARVEATLTPTQVAGKDAFAATAANGQAQYMYPRNDVLWVVFAEEPVVTEIFQKLP